MLHVNKVFPWSFNCCLICKFSFSSKPLVNVRKGCRGGAKHLIQRALTCVTPSSPWNERHRLDWSAASDRTRKPNAVQGGVCETSRSDTNRHPCQDPPADEVGNHVVTANMIECSGVCSPTHIHTNTQTHTLTQTISQTFCSLCPPLS